VAASNPSTTYAYLPFGLKPNVYGLAPTLISLPVMFVAVLIGTSTPGEPTSSFPTTRAYALVPFGVTATLTAMPPWIAIDFSTEFVALSIAVTVLGLPAFAT